MLQCVPARELQRERDQLQQRVAQLTGQLAEVAARPAPPPAPADELHALQGQIRSLQEAVQVGTAVPGWLGLCLCRIMKLSAGVRALVCQQRSGGAEAMRCDSCCST